MTIRPQCSSLYERRMAFTLLSLTAFLLFFPTWIDVVDGQPASSTAETAAVPFALPKVTLEVGQVDSPDEVSTGLQVILILTVLSLAPSLLVMMTSFTRIVIVLSFVRRGIATQQMPSNQILVGLALFLTLFTMGDVFSAIHDDALMPFLDKKIDQKVALKRAMVPVRKFMLRHTREKDLALFMKISQNRKPRNADDIPIQALIPAYMISEIKTAFQMGVIIFIPFLVVDMVTAAVLMSMGMIMLPPIMISLPFKVLLFVLVDGWNQVVRALVTSI